MKNRQIVSFAFLTVAILALTFVAYKQQAQVQEDVLVIRQGRQITDEERAYGRAYVGAIYHSGKRISEFSGTEDIDVILPAGGGGPGMPNTAPLTLQQVYEKQICDSDAIIVGRAGNKTIHLTEDETLVYTQYDITVQEILKNNSFSPIQINNIIEVSRPGGKINLNGRLIRFIAAGFTPLENNRNYLLFLKYVPEAKGYRPIAPSKDYLINGNQAIKAKISEVKNSVDKFEDATLLLNLFRATASSIRCRQN